VCGPLSLGGEFHQNEKKNWDCELCDPYKGFFFKNVLKKITEKTRFLDWVRQI
jgi:hypothetical protein